MKLFSLFSIFLAAQAQTAVNSVAYVTIGKVSPIVLKLGKTQGATIPANVLKGHHIQANPATLPNLIATELVLEGVEGLEIVKTKYPQSKPWKLKTANKVIETYEGNVEITVELLAKNLKPGAYELKGNLKYQACDEKNCFFPTSVPVVVPLTVVK